MNISILQPLLAQADLAAVPADTFKWTMIIIIGLVLVVLQVWGFFRAGKTAITPDPLRVEKLDKFSTRDFCEGKHNEMARRLAAHDAEIATIRTDMKEDRRNNEIHASARSANLHGKIDSVRSELSDQIQDMPTRIIDQLSKLNLLRKPHE